MTDELTRAEGPATASLASGRLESKILCRPALHRRCEVTRTRLVVVAVAALMAAAVPSAGKQCGLFSQDEACRPSSPFNTVTLTRDGQDLVGVDTAQTIELRLRRPVIDQPIDCEMVRRVDSSEDPSIVQRPPADVLHSMRVREVPPCPEPESERAPIR